ncbi:hypothetical protein BJV82DRAFT_194512 [Fennellomyces sp. T-0311]|nr:hypothetical protein BJV82DRAFT_194512 [Fennellomyces sp. T-0311]
MTHRKIMAEVNSEPVVTLSDRVLSWCHKLSMLRNQDWFSIQKVTVPFLNEAVATMDESPLDVIVANILHRAAMTLATGTSNVELEDTFVHSFISNLFESIFMSESALECAWANGKLGGKRKHHEVDNPFKPDYIVFIAQKAARFDITCAEAKSPSNSRATFPRSDFTKLGLELKWMINTLVRNGIQDPVVGGVLIRGFELSTYKMELSHPGVYRFVELSKTTIFKSIQQMSLVPSIAANLIQLKEITLSTAIKTKERLLQRSHGESANACPPVSFIRDEFYSLVKRRKKSYEGMPKNKQ